MSNPTAIEVIRPAIAPDQEHLFTPLMWVSFKDGAWNFRFDWSESYQYSHDIAKEINVGPNAALLASEVRFDAPDYEFVCELVDRLVTDGTLPPNSDTKKDGVLPEPYASVPAFVPDIDPMEFWA